MQKKSDLNLKKIDLNKKNLIKIFFLNHDFFQPWQLDGRSHVVSALAANIFFPDMTVFNQLLLCALYVRCNAPMVF